MKLFQVHLERKVTSDQRAQKAKLDRKVKLARLVQRVRPVHLVRKAKLVLSGQAIKDLSEIKGQLGIKDLLVTKGRLETKETKDLLVIKAIKDLPEIKGIKGLLATKDPLESKVVSYRIATITSSSNSKVKSRFIDPEIIVFNDQFYKAEIRFRALSFPCQFYNIFCLTVFKKWLYKPIFKCYQCSSFET